MSTTTVATPKTVNISTQKLDLPAQLQAAIDGTNALMPGVDPFVINKQTITRASLFATFQEGIDAARATKEARLALVAALAHEREVNASIRPLRGGFKTYAQARFGKNAPELQKLGFVQNRKPRKTAAKTAEGVAKAKATRTARATKGRQQKAPIKGAAAPAPAPMPTPAPTPTPARSPSSGSAPPAS